MDDAAGRHDNDIAIAAATAVIAAVTIIIVAAGLWRAR
jgi:hypothetical protein